MYAGGEDLNVKIFQFLYDERTLLRRDYPHDVSKCDTRHRKTLRQSIIGHAPQSDAQVHRDGSGIV